ncbi:MAG TPA: hypothetical protein VK904_09510 [Miltoncostaeaceae bacterium]|nr:hypothetical protein [Miltoncostaeaceae bacterium]
MTAPRTTWPFAPAGALLAAALLALAFAPRASAALTATDLRVASNPKVVRVIVDFAGARLTGLERQVDAIDPEISDGRGVVRVNATGITSGATPVTAGVTARILRRPGSILIRIDGAQNRFKFLQYKVSVPRNVLVIDLWKATADRAATVLSDGCLRLTDWTGTNGRARARGLELQPLFEHGLVLSLRAPGAGGSTLGERAIIAREGTFLPDFSGYAIPGRWNGGTPPIPGLPRRAMLEAWAASAKDGSLECLVQVPIRVIP